MNHLKALTAEQAVVLSPVRLLGMHCGIEKESLRSQPGGELALTPHPAALGSALTHPHITTDFSDWATNCPEYKVTAVQISASNGPTEWQEEYEALSTRSRRVETGIAAE